MTADEAALRSFLARILGYGAAQDVEHALGAIRLAVTHRAALVLLGAFDLVPIAQAIHRRTVGADQPFIVCDPRRGDHPETVRDPANVGQGVAAFHAARGGSLCLRERRPPADLSALAALARAPAASVTVIVCAATSFRSHPLLLGPAPIHVPLLSTRLGELPQIVDEYAREAAEELAADPSRFTLANRAWVIDHSAATVDEIEKGVRRLVALRAVGSVNGAAKCLGMSHASLSRWLSRRRAVRSALR